MTWHAQLDMNYAFERDRSVVRYRHEGPIRILQSLYPEGHQICHNVLVHPPGGLVGGDQLDIRLHLGTKSHALITTPGATRFYRSVQGEASNRVIARLDDGARLEWLPLETLAYSGCEAHNAMRFELAPTAELMAWDITALGLDHAQAPFTQGRLTQHMEIPNVWLERGIIKASDHRLLDSPLALAGQRCMATLLFASGLPLNNARANQALEAVRAILESSPQRERAAATMPTPQTLVLRSLTPMVEPAMELMRQAWAVWRETLWGLPGTPPRLWRL
jgi:urease accessory protein